MRTYVLTDREQDEINKYLSGQTGKTPYLKLIVARAKQVLPDVNRQVELLDRLLREVD